MNATSQRHPLYVGDLVAKFKAQGLIRVSNPLTSRQLDAVKTAVRDQKRSQKKARVL